MVRRRDFARHRHLPPTDQPHIGDCVVGGATRTHRDQRGVVAGEAGNAEVMYASCEAQTFS
jgi:hypothetical protein